jgi:hypothetical protein
MTAHEDERTYLVTKRRTIMLGVGAAVLAAAIAVPTIAAATRDAPKAGPTSQAGATLGSELLDAGAFQQRLQKRIDAAVADGWITPKLAARLKTQLEAGSRLLQPNLRDVEAQVLAPAAKALGTTPAKLREELRSGLTFGQILRAHGKSPRTLLDGLLDRLDQQLGAAVGKGRLSQQPIGSILERIQQRLGAWLERLLAQGS